MEGTKKMPWLVKLIVVLLCIVIFLTIAVFGVCVFVQKKYDINVFSLVGSVKTLNQKIDEDAVYTYKFSNEDLEGAKNVVNAQVDNMIKLKEDNTYEISLENLESSLASSIELTDKQIGAVINNIYINQSGGKIEFSGTSFEVSIIQFQFLNTTTTSTSLNFVAKINTSVFKENMSSFPFSIVKNYIPDTLYLSCTNTISKETNPFSYTVKSESLTINKLSIEKTAEIFDILNKFVSIGTVSDFNVQLGKTFADALIGNENTAGFAYSLKDYGASDYSFKTDGTNQYFVIERNTSL